MSEEYNVASHQPEEALFAEAVEAEGIQQGKAAPEEFATLEPSEEQRDVPRLRDTLKESVMQAKTLWDKNHCAISEFLAVGLLAAAIGILIYFISGPALAFFHADCADTLLWAQITVESGEILSEDFYYAGILPFGASLWMVPILKIFGYTMTAQIISMCIFAVVFVLSAYSLFRALKLRPIISS